MEWVMRRSHPVVRDAVSDDADDLLRIWTDFTSDPPRQPRPCADVDDVRRAVAKLTEDPLQRLVVAVVESRPVGVVHLRRAPVSPIHGEDAVHVGYLHVLSAFRRRGIGKQLMETAASWAEETGSKHIVASVAANARESNRFLMRLGMSQVAVVRATTVCGLKTRLRRPVGQTMASNVVAARRVMRLTSSREPAGT
jgi:ribosomal protein S18 acetylase RimI-like enzyme